MIASIASAFLNEQRAGVYRAGDAKDARGRIVPFLKWDVR